MTIYPFVLELGPITVTGYGLMMMAAFLMAGWAIQLELRERGLGEEYAADIVVAAVVGGLVGAKIWYVIWSRDWGSLFHRGGFVWYGGLLGGIGAVLFNGWRLQVPPRYTMELTGAPLALGYALGRVGCFLVNDDYGIPSTLPWAMKFPNGLPPTTVEQLSRFHLVFPPGSKPFDVLAVHPTQIYETVLMFLAFLLLWHLRRHKHGTGWRFGVYLVLAGAERFLIEFVRAKDDRIFGPLSVAQVTSLLVVLAGVAVMVSLRAPGPAETQIPKRLAPQPAQAPAV
jgi:phosphatidylglycerol:prolipoprotein diacylglycerol transferase